MVGVCSFVGMYNIHAAGPRTTIGPLGIKYQIIKPNNMDYNEIPYICRIDHNTRHTTPSGSLAVYGDFNVHHPTATMHGPIKCNNMYWDHSALLSISEYVDIGT